jgi:hypothetical protein
MINMDFNLAAFAFEHQEGLPPGKRVSPELFGIHPTFQEKAVFFVGEGTEIVKQTHRRLDLSENMGILHRVSHCPSLV